ncbi:MAG: efflux RND transporter permease subunit, partial [Pseudomonadota bacterium]
KTEENVNKVEAALKDVSETRGLLTFTQDQGGYVILPLKPIEERKLSADEIVNSIRGRLVSFPSFDAWPWSFSSGLPSIDDDASDSSTLNLQISTVDTYQNLFNEISKTRDIGEKNKLFKSLYHNLKLDSVGYSIELDKNVMADLNINKEQVAKTLSIFFSGIDTLEFKKDGILYPITIEGDKSPWNLEELFITNSKGDKISLGSFAKIYSKSEPKTLEHYNQMRSVKLSSDLTSYSNLKESMNVLYKLADDNLPKSYKKSWVGSAKTFTESSNIMSILFILALLFIYAILAVQFESFIDPLIILFTVPLACSGALIIMYLLGNTLNIYSQVGLITLIGLITKHGILIVEFANQLQKQGVNVLDSVQKAASLRLRPILMTTGAMICGSIPLILSISAGYEARQAIGVVLVSGLSLGTFFVLFVLPSVYYLVYMWREK